MLLGCKVAHTFAEVTAFLCSTHRIYAVNHYQGNGYGLENAVSAVLTSVVKHDTSRNAGQ